MPPSAQTAAAPAYKKKRVSFVRDIRKNPFSYLLLLPAAVYVFTFSYLTLPYILMAFEKYNYKTGLFGS